MANERLILAIGQMERALTRLETAQARIASQQPSYEPSPDADLAKRHAQLKAAAGDALAGLDAMLAQAR